MIHSMTAFAREQSQGDWGSFVCEMRSINHRYLEISLHLPEMLRPLEMPIRERIRQFVSRGKIECSIRYQANPSVESSSFVVNLPLAKELCQASELIATFLTASAPVHPALSRRTSARVQAHIFPPIPEGARALRA